MAPRARLGAVRAGVPRERRRRRPACQADAEELKEIGVASVGHRRRLLEAIASLRADTAPSSAPLAERTGPDDRGRTAAAHGDVRRPRRLDGAFAPGSIPRRCEACSRPTRTRSWARSPRFEGHVAKFMGDGVLAYFGWPGRARGRGRARRPGRARRRGGRGRLRAPDGEPLAARAGIATGLVVVGDLVGSGEAREERGDRRDAEPRRPAAGARGCPAAW